MLAAESAWAGSLPQQRVEAIANAVLDELRQLQVPVPLLQVGIFPGLDSHFDFEPWRLQVNTERAFGRVGQSPVPAIAELGDTITHEARHCEQWYRMARLLATQRRAEDMLVDAHEISQRLGIDNLAVCQQAAAAPLLTGIEKSEAREWYQSIYGSQASFRGQTFTTKLKLPGLAIGASWQDSQYARYQRSLAEEDDAWIAGTAWQRLYLDHHPGVLPIELAHHTPVRHAVSTH